MYNSERCRYVTPHFRSQGSTYFKTTLWLVANNAVQVLEHGIINYFKWENIWYRVVLCFTNIPNLVQIISAEVHSYEQIVHIL
jgi:hypothetical protein